jgi:hypothetical protein
MNGDKKFRLTAKRSGTGLAEYQQQQQQHK